jgi:hypothetical protein
MDDEVDNMLKREAKKLNEPVKKVILLDHSKTYHYVFNFIDVL